MPNSQFAPKVRVGSAPARCSAAGGSSGPTTPEQFGEFIRSESVKWRPIVTEMGIRLE